jgi:hypothetical protein
LESLVTAKRNIGKKMSWNKGIDSPMHIRSIKQVLGKWRRWMQKHRDGGLLLPERMRRIRKVQESHRERACPDILSFNQALPVCSSQRPAKRLPSLQHAVLGIVIQKSINTGNAAAPLRLCDANGGWEWNIVLRAWASLAGNGTRCCMCMGSRIHLWASNIGNVAVVVRSRVVFEDGGTHMVEPMEQSVEQEESQASLGMPVRKPHETASQQKRVRVEFT